MYCKNSRERETFRKLYITHTYLPMLTEVNDGSIFASLYTPSVVQYHYYLQAGWDLLVAISPPPAPLPAPSPDLK